MFTKTKKFIKVLTPEDWLDITLEIKNKKITKFALNYRALIKNKWKQIYRVDNFHGFLHEQKFWRSPKTIPIKNKRPLSHIFKEYSKEIIKNYKKYRRYFEQKQSF